ncbi:MAG: biotin/lipoyl-containing protein, partial [Myxococcota bacterium]|nr:biotin/lipoyl-containing protein [Myxococcota bacterium]
QRTAHVAWDDHGSSLHLRVGEVEATFEQVVPGAKRQSDEGSDGKVTAPMSGRVLGVHVQVGDRVDKGQNLLTLEAMKLETNLASPVSGEVAEVRVSPEDQVTQRQLLVAITPDTETEE